MKKIILTGFMGSGKTTVGMLLAAALGVDFIDTDDEILKIAGENTVADIFKKQGEAAFRKLESRVAESIGKLAKSSVIATGGGMLVNEHNLALVKNNAIVIYLKTDFINIKMRVEDQMKEKQLTRPLFSDIQEAMMLFEKRAPLYAKAADYTVTTDNKSAEEVCAELKRIAESK